MISFKKEIVEETYVPTGLAHELNFKINHDGVKKITKEIMKEIEAFLIINNDVEPDLTKYDFKNILVLNIAEFEQLKNKRSLTGIIASAEVIDLRN